MWHDNCERKQRMVRRPQHDADQASIAQTGSAGGVASNRKEIVDRQLIGRVGFEHVLNVGPVLEEAHGHVQDIEREGAHLYAGSAPPVDQIENQLLCPVVTSSTNSPN